MNTYKLKVRTPVWGGGLTNAPTRLKVVFTTSHQAFFKGFTVRNRPSDRTRKRLHASEPVVDVRWGSLKEDGSSACTNPRKARRPTGSSSCT